MAENAENISPDKPQDDPKLDPKNFELHANPDNWTGRGHKSRQHYWTHADRPGKTYSQEDVEAIRLAQEKKVADNVRMGHEEMLNAVDKKFKDRLSSEDSQTGAGPADIDDTSDLAMEEIGLEEETEENKLGKKPAKRKTKSKPKVSEMVGSKDDADVPRWKKFNAKDYIGVEIKTLESIIHSPEDQHYFSLMLTSLDPSMTATFSQAFDGTKLSSDQREMLKYAVHEYSKWMPRAKAVSEKISPRDVELAAIRNEDIDLDVLMKGKDRYADLFKGEVLKAAMSNSDRFQTLENAYSSLNNDRKRSRFAKYEKRAREICNKVGIREKDFDLVFDMENKAEARRALKARLRQDMGSFRKAIDSTLGMVRLSKADRAMMNAKDLNNEAKKNWFGSKSAALLRIDENLDVITNVMNKTMTGNPEVQLLLEQEALTAKKLTLSDDVKGPTTFDEAKKSADQFSEPEVVKRYNKARSEAKIDGRSYNDWTPEERNNFREKFDVTAGTKKERSKGFLTIMIEAFIRNLWGGSRRDKLPLENI